MSASLCFWWFLLCSHIFYTTEVSSVPDEPKKGSTDTISHDTRIIYDISQYYHNWNNSSRDDNIQLSKTLYTIINKTAHVDICQDIELDGTQKEREEFCNHFGIAGIAITFKNENKVFDAKSISFASSTNKTILNILQLNSSKIESLVLLIKVQKGTSCYCSSIQILLKRYLEKSLRFIHQNREQQSVKVELALAYNANELDCCGDVSEQFNILRLVTRVIIEMDRSPQDKLFSYGILSKQINSMTKFHQDFMQKYNPNCKLYIKINVQKVQNLSSEIMDRYNALITKYVNWWINENTASKEIFIISSFPVNTHLTNYNNMLQMKVSPIYRGKSFLLDKEVGNICDSSCNLQTTLKLVSSVFKQVFVINSNFKYICSLVKTCNNSSLGFHNNTELSLAFPLYQENLHNALVQKLIQNVHLFNIKTMYFSNCRSSWNTSLWNSTVNLLKSKNISIGCYVTENWCKKVEASNFSELVLNFLDTNCGRLLDISTKVSALFSMQWPLEEMIPPGLQNISLAIKMFKKKYPEKQLIPHIIISHTKVDIGSLQSLEMERAGSDIEPVPYCSSSLERMNELYDSILTHADIHNWDHLFIRPVTDDPRSNGWWQNIQVNQSINRFVTKFPILIRSNALRIEHYGNLTMSYQCVKWTKSAKESEIDFLSNRYSGATVDINLRPEMPTTKKEVETLLLFAFSRFSFVELLGFQEYMKNWTRTFSPTGLLKSIQEARKFPDGEKRVLIEMPISKNNETVIYSQLSSLISVYISNWENFNETDWLLLSDKYTFISGLLIKNCIDEINLNLSRIISVPIIGNINHIICNVWPVPPENSNQVEMQKYLNTLFYSKSFIETRVKSEIEVYFRINVRSSEVKSCKSDQYINNFLSFLNDVNQHSKAYKIRYFVVQAFTEEISSGECLSSLWRIENYSDLSNISVYVDREAEYMGNPTKSPLKIAYPTESNVDPNDSNMKLFVIIPIFVLLFFGLLPTILILFLRFRRMKNKLLEKTDVIEFYDGTEMNLIDADNTNWLRLKFPKEFEIPKYDIDIGRAIGSGEFGIVYYGMLKDEIEIAVKTSHLNCDKDKFKTILSEVKLLCYIGRNENIVSFLGACTKQIMRGKIFIVTEYCEKGSLQSYLQEELAKHKITENKEIMYQFYRFCYEIACGMEYISSKQVVHRDLATRNVLLSSEFTCKICDFGLSRHVNETGEYVKDGEELMAWRWMAPESLKNNQFTSKSDVWSYGVTVWEIFSLGSLPFSQLSSSQGFATALENGLQMEKALFATDLIHGQLLFCWNIFPEERPSFEELSQHFMTLRTTEYSKF